MYAYLINTEDSFIYERIAQREVRKYQKSNIRTKQHNEHMSYTICHVSTTKSDNSV